LIYNFSFYSGKSKINLTANEGQALFSISLSRFPLFIFG